MEIKLTKDNFDAAVLGSDRPVLVDFWASWCMPCRMIAPVVAQLAEELADRATVGKVNVDEEPELAQRYRVTSIPTLIVFKNGQETRRTIGAQNKSALEKLLQD